MAQEMDVLFSNSKALQPTMVKSSKFPKVLYSNRSLASFLMVANSTRLAIIGVFCVILGYFGSSFYGLHKCLPIEVFGESPRHKAMAFVGIHTGFSSLETRNILRETWMPSDLHGLRRLEESTGLAIRFVIGRSSTRSKMEALEKEIHKYDDFLLLDVEENDMNLPLKTLAFFKEAYRLYDCDFYVKLNDGVYLRPDRLSLLLAKYRPHSLTYIGCMKNGDVVGDPKHKWYDTFHHVLKSEYFLHAHGAMYALSSDIVSTIVSMRNDSFRMFNNENVLIGSWMLAMNINHEHEKELCQTQCTTSSIAVWNISCSGVCHPEQKLIELHKMDICSKSPAMASSD